MKKLLFAIFTLGITSCQSTFYVVRHAEKATQPKENPPLTEAGQVRAESLKMELFNKKINKIYATNTIRAFSTAKPISSAKGVMIEYYANDILPVSIFLQNMKKLKGKNVLIVGHSNTLRGIVNGLYEHDTLKKDLADNEYDKLFIVKRKFFPHKTSFEMKIYGATPQP